MKLPNKKFTKKKSEQKSEPDKEFNAYMKKLDKASILDDKDRETIRKQVEKDLEEYRKNRKRPGDKGYDPNESDRFYKKIMDKVDGKVRRIINRKGKLTKKIVKGDGKGNYGLNESRFDKVYRNKP